MLYNLSIWPGRSILELKDGFLQKFKLFFGEANLRVKIPYG